LVNSEVQTARLEPGASNMKDFIDTSQAFDKVWHTTFYCPSNAHKVKKRSY